MASKRTYTAEPQRLIIGKGYRPCLDHQACRYAVIETRTIPASRGRRAAQVKRTLAIFHGSGMRLEANLMVDQLMRKSQPAKRKRLGFLGRAGLRGEYSEPIATSCTREEYDAIERQHQAITRAASERNRP